jgi:hypothetical protein
MNRSGRSAFLHVTFPVSCPRRYCQTPAWNGAPSRRRRFLRRQASVELFPGTQPKRHISLPDADRHTGKHRGRLPAFHRRLPLGRLVVTTSEAETSVGHSSSRSFSGADCVAIPSLFYAPALEIGWNAPDASLFLKLGRHDSFNRLSGSRFQLWKTLRNKRIVSANARSVASGSKRGPSSRVKACSAGYSRVS